MNLSELVKHDAIVPQLQASDRDGVVRELLGALADAAAIERTMIEPLCKATIDRERKGSTGFGKGVAIPHVKHKAVARPVAAVGNSAKGIDFKSLDGQPVHSVVLLVSPDNADQHLAAMNVIWPNLNNDRFRRFLRQAKTKQEVIELLGEAQGI